DSGLGAGLLRARGLAADPYAMAASPDEQDSLCNARKADKLPAEAGMTLRFTPYVPTWDQLHAPGA
ncbi:hypothetical protein AB0M71_48555, partial [Amycolatopsis sp. NPDC051114]